MYPNHLSLPSPPRPSLIKKLEELERTEEMYRGMVDHTRRVLMGYYDLVRVCKEIGDEFCKIGVREPQKSANEAFCEFGECFLFSLLLLVTGCINTNYVFPH